MVLEIKRRQMFFVHKILKLFLPLRQKTLILRVYFKFAQFYLFSSPYTLFTFCLLLQRQLQSGPYFLYFSGSDIILQDELVTLINWSLLFGLSKIIYVREETSAREVRGKERKGQETAQIPPELGQCKWSSSEQDYGRDPNSKAQLS